MYLHCKAITSVSDVAEHRTLVEDVLLAVSVTVHVYIVADVMLVTKAESVCKCAVSFWLCTVNP